MALPAHATTYYTPVQYNTPVYYTTYSNANLYAYLQSLIAQLELLQRQYQQQYGSYHYNAKYDVEVETEAARSIEDDEATLYGTLDLDRSPYARVWFEYGTDGRLDERSTTLRLDDDDDFDIEVDDLDEDEKYYYRAVAEDASGHRVYGEIRSFTTDEDNRSRNDDEPEVETGDADDITDDSVEINGEVDMNDFNDGLVFFVIGEDEDRIEDVEDEDTYRDVDERGDDLQKYKVRDDLDGSREFRLSIDGLDDDTEYYYRICVEYEDEDDDDVLVCGDVESFTTDN